MTRNAISRPVFQGRKPAQIRSILQYLKKRSIYCSYRSEFLPEVTLNKGGQFFFCRVAGKFFKKLLQPIPEAVQRWMLQHGGHSGCRPEKIGRHRERKTGNISE